MQHPFEHDITALAYDLIDGVEREKLLEHLAACDPCRALYDSYRDEQLAVRDAITRDARSGAAEAKALETTLRMLGGLGDEKEAAPKRGRLLRMPTWLIAAEVAAMLLVSIGLIFLLKPEDERAEVVPVAAFNRAPATIETGVAYVQTPAGEWKAAEAVPVDQWVKTGDELFAIKLNNGSRAEMQAQSIFRISFGDEAGQPIVHMLRGDGVIQNFGASNDVLVRSGDAGFYAFPGATLSLACTSGDAQPRSWSMPEFVRAKVVSGDVMLWAESQPVSHMPLRVGEGVEWNSGAYRILAGENAIVLDRAYQAGSQFVFVAALEDRDAQALRAYEMFLPRLREYEAREGEMRFDVKIVEEQLAELKRTLNRQVVALMINGVSIELSTDGETLTLKFTEAGGTTSTHEARTIEALKARVPAHIAGMLDDVEITRENGKYRLRSAHAEATGEGKKTVNVKIQTQSKD